MAQKRYISMCITHVRYIICNKTYLKRVTTVAQHPRRLRVASVASALALIDALSVLDVSRPRLDGWGYGNGAAEVVDDKSQLFGQRVCASSANSMLPVEELLVGA
jgi:hypothetical protein